MKILNSMTGKLGLAALLCAACCALPLLGLLGSSMAAFGLSFLENGVESLLFAGLALVGLAIWMLRLRRPDASACKANCERGC